MVLLGAFVDVEGDVFAIAVSAVALSPAFAAHVLSDLGQLLFSLHGMQLVASQISSLVDSALVAVESLALCSCC